ncbi:hypothetical protein ACFU96_21705 [Streptomyces sp. NPDC057620]|uniref:hypothetical protein n=1 Tax=Streptomyces sp. NPDC057620 TaxID=3346185 RepID=UPI003690A093
MGLFRRSISTEELRAGQPEDQKDTQTTEYRASRGGWFPKKETPVPGARRKK